MKTFSGQGNLTTILQNEWRGEKNQKEDEHNNLSIDFTLFNEKVVFSQKRMVDCVMTKSK